MAKTIKITIAFKNNINEIINGDLYFPDNITFSLPLIIISHGFKGWKDWGFLPNISESFANNGAFVACINFSLNGSPQDDLFIADVEKFARNTVSQELKDLGIVIDNFKNGNISGQLDSSLSKQFENSWNGDIYLSGHSLGGGVSLITAKNNTSVKKVSVWASIGKFDRYSERQKAEWHKKGVMEFNNLTTKQLLKLNVSYLEDIEQHTDSFNLPAILAELDKPVLLLHGKHDVTVPLREIQPLIDADRNCILTSHIIDRTGHTFGIEHPFTKTTTALETAKNLTINFFNL